MKTKRDRAAYMYEYRRRNRGALLKKEKAYRKRTREARKAYYRKWYLANRERMIQKSVDRYHANQKRMNAEFNAYKKKLGRKRKKYLVSLLGGKCVQCGETRISQLCFHHPEPEKKAYTVSHRITRYRINELLKEVVLTVLMCRHCHAVYHNKLRKGVA